MTKENSMTRENSKILISAASGKVGQHVVTELALSISAAATRVQTRNQSVTTNRAVS
jgi:uncharacterized protein YbjT (DUF2867 family)